MTDRVASAAPAALPGGNYTVTDAVNDWLLFGLAGRSPSTVDKWDHLTRTHVIPSLGRRRLRDLTAADVDHWLADKATTLSTSTLQSLQQAQARLRAATGTPMDAYITVSLLTGARTEELRALTWERVDLDGDPAGSPPRPPSVEVWRSVRRGGDTKTRASWRQLGWIQDPGRRVNYGTASCRCCPTARCLSNRPPSSWATEGAA